MRQIKHILHVEFNSNNEKKIFIFFFISMWDYTLILLVPGGYWKFSVKIQWKYKKNMELKTIGAYTEKNKEKKTRSGPHESKRKSAIMKTLRNVVYRLLNIHTNIGAMMEVNMRILNPLKKK